MSNGARVMQATAVVLVDGRPAGSAVLVGNRHLLTAAHVLMSVGQAARAGQVEVAFPAISGPEGTPARLKALLVPTRVKVGPVDAAVLDIGEQPPEWVPPPLTLSPTRRVPKRVSVFGFPHEERELRGVWREFDTSGPTAADTVQLDWVRPVGTLRGQSGGPVIDPQTSMVVGVLVEGSEPGKFDRFIPAGTIADRWPDLPRPWLMRGADTAAAEEHFHLRAQGQRSQARGGDLFRGRHAVLAAARNWLSADAAPGRPLVIIGQPGAGKSAAIARAVIDLQADKVGPGLAFHGHGSTYFDLLTAVADLTGVDRASSTHDLVDVLKNRSDGPWLIVVDALDEAATPIDRHEMAKLLTELAILSTLRVAVATRALAPGAVENRYQRGALLPALGVTAPDSPSLVDLDTDQFFEPSGVKDYAAALLEQSGADHPGPAGHAWIHYRNNTFLRDRLASAISARAGRNYLVAAMAADRLSTERDVVNPDDPAFAPVVIPASVSEALDKYLGGLEEHHRIRVRGLLTALAYARGVGIDDQTWLTFAAALGYSVGIEDLDGLYDAPAADYLLQLTPSDDGAPVTRLFHQALAEDLLRRRRHRLGDEQALLDALLPPLDRGWEQASTYARNHAGDHAAACKQLPTLLQDQNYLAVADLTRLLLLLPAHPNPRDAPITSVLRQIAVEATPLSPLPRIRLLALTAARNGLQELHRHLTAACDSGLVPLWGQPLGAPHQILTTDVTDSVRAVAVGRAGNRDVILSGGEDRIIRVWDALTGELLGDPLTGHTDTVWAVAVGRAGDRDIIVSGSGDETVRIWDAETGELLGDPLTGHTDTVWAVAVGRAGDRDVIVSGSGDETVRIWDAETRALIGNPLNAQAPVVAVAASKAPDHDIIAFGCVLGTQGPSVKESWHDVKESWHANIGRAGDHQLILRRMVDGAVGVWDASSDCGWVRQGFSGGVWAVAVGRAGDREIVASGGGDETVRVWDAAFESVGDPLTGHTDTVWAVAVGRAGDRDVIVSGSGDETVRVWDAETREPIGNPLTGHGSSVTAVALGQAGGRDIIVSGSEDSTVRIWDIAAEQQTRDLRTRHPGPVSSMAVGRTGGRDILVSVCDDDSVRVWSALTGELINTLGGRLMDMTDAVAVGRAGDRDIIVSGGGDRTVRVWDATTLELIGEPIGDPFGPRPNPFHTLLVSTVAVGRAGDRDIIVSGGWDATVRVWDATTHQPIGDPLQVPNKFVHAVAVGRAGDRDIIVSGSSDESVRVWDAVTGQPIGTLAGHSGGVSALAMGRAGNSDIIVSGSDDESVRVWDAVTGQPIGTLAGHSGGVSALAVGRAGDCDIIVSGDYGGMVRVWDTNGNLVDLVDQVYKIGAVALSSDGTLYVAADVAICAYTPPGRKT